MYKILLVIILFFVNKNIHAKTELHFIMNDPQTASLYRGFQVGVKSIGEEGQTDWYARVRFADQDDKICQGRGVYTKERIAVGIATGTMISAISYLIKPSFNENSTYTNSLVAFTALASAVTTGILWPSVYEGLGYFKSKVFIKYKKNTLNSSEEVDGCLINEQECSDISISSADDLKSRNCQPNEKLIAFGWTIEKSLSLSTLISHINDMRVNKKFPQYTLYGASCFIDSLNCVSFCIRLSHKLGVPFKENNNLHTYIKPEPLSFRSIFISAATPERIARILLDDANLGGNADIKSWVNTDCSWWINTTLEDQANAHCKAQKGISNV